MGFIEAKGAKLFGIASKHWVFLLSSILGLNLLYGFAESALSGCNWFLFRSCLGDFFGRLRDFCRRLFLDWIGNRRGSLLWR